MNEALKRIGALLVSMSVAAWLRMFDPSLSMQYWANLIGKPVKLWVAALLIMPVFEFIYSWPAHLVIAGIHSLICRLKYDDKPSLGQAIGLGAVIGAASFLLIATSSGDWIMRSTQHNVKVFFIYATAGICYGWAYFLFIAKPKRNQDSRITPLAEGQTTVADE